jgi:hypothetical protein
MSAAALVVVKLLTEVPKVSAKKSKALARCFVRSSAFSSMSEAAASVVAAE